MKKVLALYYSQTGQLERIMRSTLEPFLGRDDIEVHFQEMRPVTPYPFPWPVIRFFDQFPECVALDPPEIELPGFDPDVKYDLVMFGYQTWYLSPSSPATGFLKSRYAKVLRDTPVVTVIGCRNMWFKGQIAVRRMIEAAGGRFAGNIVREDQGTRAETFITVTVWLLTGRRETWPGVLSPAGVSEQDIAGSSRYGRQVLDGLVDGRLQRGERVLDGHDSAFVLQKYILVEEVATRGFKLGAWLVRLAGKQGSFFRVPLLGVFALCLGIGICTVIPVTLLFLLIISPSAGYKRWMQEQTRYLEGT